MRALAPRILADSGANCARQTGSNGANLSFPTAMGIPDSGDVCDGREKWCEDNSWIVGFVNAMPYITIWIL